MCHELEISELCAFFISGLLRDTAIQTRYFCGGWHGQLYMILVIRAAVCYWIYEQQRDTRYRLTVEVVSSLDPVICQGVVLRSVFERYTPECRAVSQCATSLKFQSCVRSSLFLVFLILLWGLALVG